ncbi:hypothetical protein [Actinomadura hibisca]|uniref:hypothetical protein n=1 Tax=Actinomadura hibisca TaxID=68565 RepID=UPI000834FDB7|nr:hypothetical protein [Actinomadura hibisca]
MTDMSQDELQDIRKATLKGLRELADFLEAHPDLPEPTLTTFSPFIRGGDDERQCAEVDRIALVLDVETTGHGTKQYSACRYFGSVEYCATAFTDEVVNRPDAVTDEDDTATLDPYELLRDEPPEETRESIIAGFRELADFLEAHPDLPAPYATMAGPHLRQKTDEEKRAEVDRIAGILGVETTDSANGHYNASRYFGLHDNPGSIEYYATAMTAPSDDFAEKTRNAALKGLRDLAGFLESHPDLPGPKSSEYVGPHISGEDEEQKRAEVDRIARILGVEATSPVDGHYSASRDFGAIEYKATAITREHMARYMAWMSYDDAVTPDPSETAMTDTPEEPGPPEDREAICNGLRELADFLEAHPELPEPTSTMIFARLDDGTEEQERAEVDRIARILGVEIDNFPRTHYSAERSFGPIEYSAVAISHECRARARALQTYRDAVTPEPGPER